MKVFLLTTYYQPFLSNFYHRKGASGFDSFASHRQALLNEFFADTGSTSHYLELEGNECFLCIVNCEPLQKQWADENGVTYSVGNWEKEIAHAQLKLFHPDVFYLDGVFEYFGDFISECSNYFKKAVAWISSPFNPTLDLNGISFIVSSTPAFIDQFRSQGIEAAYLLPAFDGRILDRISSEGKKDIPFSFIGGWSHVHIKRKEAIAELVERTKLSIWGYGYRRTYRKRGFRYYRNLVWPYDREILRHYHGEAWGLDMYDLLSRSLMTFNIHESLLEGWVGNMRMFEASGVGSMILNDEGLNLARVFEPGKEIETYSSIDEAVEKANYYMANPAKAIEIGLNAQRRTLSDYNYTNFAKQLQAYFKESLSG